MFGRHATQSRLVPLWGLVIALCFSLVADLAVAQEQPKRRNLLEMLFGPRQQVVEPSRPLQRQDRQPRARRTTNNSVTSISTGAAAASAVQKPPAKIENAKKVLVVGDFVASGLSDGLITAFEASPGVVVENRSNGSSGLVRDDFYNWPQELPGIIAEVKPAVLVVQIGANDRQQIVGSEGRLDFRTDAWFTAYEKRVNAFADIARQTNIPLVWVGLPAFRPQNMTADAIRLNAIYRRSVEQVRGDFVDVWDGFVDQEGRFIITGSDINGQQVRLRGSDGIGFTSAGKRKLAFYTEKSIRRILGDMTSPDLVRLDADNLPDLLSLAPTEMNNVISTSPISLFDPELDGASELLGSAPLPMAPILSPRDQLVSNGTLPEPPAGRIDYVRLPRPQEQQSTATP